jgi:hypothetical protein
MVYRKRLQRVRGGGMIINPWSNAEITVMTISLTILMIAGIYVIYRSEK